MRSPHRTTAFASHVTNYHVRHVDINYLYLFLIYLTHSGSTTGYELDHRGFGVRFLVGTRYILFCIRSRPALGPTQPPTQWVPGAVSPGVKPQGPEANNSAPSNAEVKNDGAIPPLPNMSTRRSAK
jgi:hypothetical protein